jgi:hypothetical protein
MVVDVTVPEGVRAELRLPGRKAAPLASGRHRLTTKLNRRAVYGPAVIW